MSQSVEKTLACLQAVQDLTVRVVGDVKSMSILHFLLDGPKIMQDLQVVVADATLVLPELKSLTADEVSQLGVAAYGLVMAVLKAAAKS